MSEGKPGYKTTEWYLSLAAMIVGALLTSGAFADGGTVATVLGLAASTLTALGYTVSRTLVKGSEAKERATKALASANPPTPAEQ